MYIAEQHMNQSLTCIKLLLFIVTVVSSVGTFTAQRVLSLHLVHFTFILKSRERKIIIKNLRSVLGVKWKFMNKLLLLADEGGAWPHEKIKEFIPAVRGKKKRVTWRISESSPEPSCCTSQGLFCRCGRSLALAGRPGSGHITENKWTKGL